MLKIKIKHCDEYKFSDILTEMEVVQMLSMWSHLDPVHVFTF